MSQTKSFGDSKTFGCIPFVSGWLRRKNEKKEAMFRNMLQKQIKNVKEHMNNSYERILYFVKQIKIYENLICIIIKEGELICSIDNSKYFEYLCDKLHKHINTLKESANYNYGEMILYYNACKTHKLYKYIKHDIEKILCFIKLKLENTNIYNWHYQFYEWSDKTDIYRHTEKIIKPINSEYFINLININKYRTLLKLVCFQIIKLMNIDDTKYGVTINHVRDAKIKCYDVGEIIDKYKYLRNINEMIIKSTGTDSSASVYIKSFDKKYIDHIVENFYTFAKTRARLVTMYYIFLYIESNNENTLINLMKLSYICEKLKVDDELKRQQRDQELFNRRYCIE
jgi:hypothetical protein